MSEFDKEAERERLREKYERDKKDREATQRMSDLLLKGARMTNTHCGTCGDPLFEQNGVTFCPSCHGSPEGVEASLPEEDTTAGASDSTSPADASMDRPDEAGDANSSAVDGSGATPGEDGTDQTTGESARSHRDSDPSSMSAADRSTGSNRGQQSTPADPSSPASGRTVSDRGSATSSGSIEQAHGHLLETLESFSRRAAETEDPRRAKEHLEAAREAVETLAALRY